MENSNSVNCCSGDDAEETDNRKRSKISLSQDLQTATAGPFLLDLSDDVMLIILSYLPQIDIIMLGHTCSRLETLTLDRTLWLDVDCRGRALTEDTLRRALSSLLPSTRSLALDLGRVYESSLEKEDNTLAELSVSRARDCQALRALTLENARIDACRLQITHFPSRLTYWSLKGSTVEDVPFERSYFMDLHRHMPNLQTLVLSDCPWFQAHSLMAIAKCPLLRELRLDGCVHLGNCMAYCSMSARFAFKSLETLDVRRTRLSDSEIGCFNRVSTLKHLLVESLTDSDRVELAQEIADDSVTCRVLPSRCMIVLDRVNNEYIVNRQVVLRPDIHEDEINHIIRNVDSMDRFIDQGRACVEGAAPNHVEGASNARKIYIDIDVFGQRNRGDEANRNNDNNDNVAGPSRPRGDQHWAKMRVDESDSDDDEVAPQVDEGTAHCAIEDGPFEPTDFTGPDFVVRSSMAPNTDRNGLDGAVKQGNQTKRDQNDTMKGCQATASNKRKLEESRLEPRKMQRKSSDFVANEGEASSVGQGLVAFLPQITLINRTEIVNQPDGNPKQGGNETEGNESRLGEENEKQKEDDDLDDSSGESDSDSDETPAATSNFVGGRLVCCHYRSRRRPRTGKTNNLNRHADDNAVNNVVGTSQQANGNHGDWQKILRERATGTENRETGNQEEGESVRSGQRASGVTHLRVAAKKALSDLGERWEVQSSSDEDVADQARLEMLVRCAKKSRSSGEPDVGGLPGDPGPSGGIPDRRVNLSPSNGDIPGTSKTSRPGDHAPGASNMRLPPFPRGRPQHRSSAGCVRFLVPPASHLVTDAAVQDLFAGDVDWPYMVRIAAEPASRSRLETLVLRGFPGVTDLSLRMLATVPTLRALDVTGTGVTADGVATFRALRPEVKLQASFD